MKAADLTHRHLFATVSAIGLSAIALPVTPAHASCTSDGGTPERVLCIDTGVAPLDFLYDNSKQIVGVLSGTYNSIVTNDGGDEVIMDGGTIGVLSSAGGASSYLINGGAITTRLITGSGLDSFTINGGTIQEIVTRFGADTLIVNAGTINVVDTGESDDQVTVNGGTINAIETGGSDDQVTVNGGAVDEIDTGAFNDQVTIAGGTVGLLYTEGESDTIRLEGGTVNSVFAGDGSDTVFLDGAATVSTQIQGEGGFDTLRLTGNGTLDGDFLGFESLRVEFGGNWTFRQSNSAFGNSLILNSSSTLLVEAGSNLNVGDVFVDQGATLSANGTLDYAPSNIGATLLGTLTGNGTLTSTTGFGSFNFNPTSVIRPGTSIGTLTINDDVSFARGARLIAEVDPAAGQNADLLAVNGPVRGANNLTIVVEPLNPGAIASDYVAANDYVVLTGTSIDGDNPTVTESGSLPALVDVAIVGTPSTDNQIALAFTELPLTALAVVPAVTTTGNPNHASVAAGLGTTATAAPDTLLVSGATLLSAVQTLTNDQAAQLNQVHAEPFSSYQTVALEDYDMVAGIVLGRAGNSGVSFGGFSTPEDVVSRARGATAGSSGADNADSSFWASAAYVDGSVDGENGVGNFGYSIGGLVLGTDVYDDGTVRAGLFGAFNKLKLDEHDTADQEIEGDLYHIGAYGSWERQDGWTVTGVLGFAFGDHESTRQVPDVGAFTGGAATADFDSFGYYFGAEASRDIQYGRGITITPAAAVVYAKTEQDEMTETGGGDFNFNLEDSDADSLITAFGVTASRTFDGADGRWSVIGSAHYRYDWLADENSSHDVTVSNPILGTFTQVGQNRGAHGVTAGLGLSGQVSDRVEIGAGYAYSWNENGDEHGVGASILVTW